MIKYRGSGDGKNTVLSILRREGLFLPADCNGRGTCKKCRVWSEEEGAFLLACEWRPEGEFAIGWENPEGAYETASEEGFPGEEEAKDTVLVVDIGTTTLEAALIDPAKNRVIRTASSINHQRSYGADVVSRIQEAEGGALPELQRILEQDIRSLALRLGANPSTTRTIVSGNTTMQYLYEGRDVKELMRPPFKPGVLSLREKGNAVILPGVSSFVGADVLCGVLQTGMDKSSELCLLLDLGTNGEMVLGNRDRMLSASAAAGPAFEGGNISCGMAAVPGAVYAVEPAAAGPKLFVIGGKKPAGLCGSGVIETVYELRRAGLLDETGLLDERYREEGFWLAEGVSFTQKDVREVQLAKSAVRAGIETLLKAYSCDKEEIHRVYLAGGLGKGLNVQKAAGIGLLPEELAGKAVSVGNASLQGACLYASDKEAQGRMEELPGRMQELSLSDSDLFAELFMKFMVL
ncbi:MAG: DUF4445 domain-containing protein [Lachnospiraceae bacterium]|nr:DUF4445 domain-containing protein [Lachnospiraceae bacterium]